MAQLIPSLATLVAAFADCFHPQVFQTFQALQLERERSWYPQKVTPTFSDMLGALRLQTWRQRVYGASGAELPPPECIERLLQTLSAVA